MPRSFLVCRRTVGFNGNRNMGKLRQQDESGGNEAMTRVELVDRKTQANLDDKSQSSLSTVLERNPPTKSEREKLVATSQPEVVSGWTFGSDDAATGRLPMALFENGGVVLPTFTSDRFRLFPQSGTDICADQTILDLSPRSNASSSSLIGAVDFSESTSSPSMWFNCIRSTVSGAQSPPFDCRSPTPTSHGGFRLLSDFMVAVNRSTGCDSPSSSSSSSSSGFGCSESAPSTASAAASSSDTSLDGWTSMSSPRGLPPSVSAAGATTSTVSCRSSDIDVPSPRGSSLQHPKLPTTVLNLTDGRYRRRRTASASQRDVTRAVSSSSSSRGGGGGVSADGGVEARFACDECDRRYATSSNLSRHKQTHRSVDGEHARPCPHCRKLYVSMPALSMHLLTHDLKYRCSVCDKSFSRPWLLRGHERSHTGERPFSCCQCGKAFADRSNLRAHVQTHSTAKQFVCPRCSKTFALKSYLMKHCELACGQEQ